MTVLRDIRCDGCQSLDIVAVSPGTEPDHCGLFLLTPGVPLRAWCSKCWTAVTAPRQFVDLAADGAE